MRQQIKTRNWLAAGLLSVTVAGMLLLAGIVMVSPDVPAVFGAATPLASPDASPAASPQAATPSASPVPSTVGVDGTDERFVITTGEIAIEITDTRIAPRHVEVAAGHDLRVTVTNSGERVHEFTIEDLDVSIDVKPGATETVSISTPPLGEYRYGIDLGQDPHAEMTGTLTIYI